MNVLGIPLIGLIGTITIVAVVLIPPSMIKITIDREIALTYEYEKAQHALLSLLSSTVPDGKSSYEILSTYALLDKPTTSELKTRLNNVIGPNYCITTNEGLSAPPTGQTTNLPPTALSKEILAKVCPTNNIQFNTIIVMPYNKESLVKTITIGVR